MTRHAKIIAWLTIVNIVLLGYCGVCVAQFYLQSANHKYQRAVFGCDLSEKILLKSLIFRANQGRTRADWKEFGATFAPNSTRENPDGSLDIDNISLRFDGETFKGVDYY